MEEGETNTNTKFCATSLESLLDSARQVFGSNPQLKVLTTIHIRNSTTVLQNYTITEVKEIISDPNVLGCHPMPYPYAVFFCQTQKNDTKLYEVLVEGDNGAKVQAAAVCHVDTSKWDSARGKSPVCHFFHSDNLVLVLSPAATPSP
ncbi:hypothetical protein PIB30_054319 [Stylosanthes scabra]|uniref:BURP domain-containing protein n=1 Tax=Stylosanthes scabra TaxID=79078 RepID=A0ABU6TIH0_9FABA|nr:hypothetical protein [Stylosanthes scabra]